MAPDPAGDKYPQWSSYNYCLNNPLRLVDPDGRDPGDPFPTRDAAATDFGKTYNDDSIRNDREYGSTIYSTRTDNGPNGGYKIYSYTKPNKGSKASVMPSQPKDGQVAEAATHTHSAYDPKYAGDRFSGIPGNASSGGDVGYAHATKQPVYVATPNGTLKEYDPNTGNVRIVNTDMPSDPNHPSRQNNVSPTTNTNDNETRTVFDRVADFFHNLTH